MLLCSDSVCAFDILLGPDAAPAVRYAAEELQRWVDRLAQGGGGGGTFASIHEEAPGAVAEPVPAGRGRILVGDSRLRQAIFPEIDPGGLPREGYVLKTHGAHLLVLGGSPRGTLYGVYDVLERLGVRWWTPAEAETPYRRVISLPDLNVRVEPPLVYRAIWYRNVMDADWQARQRLNAGSMGPVHMRDRHGGMERFAADRTAHTYAALVPTERYFDRHPEYFSEVKGRRLRYDNQLCCTNPEVARLAAETARDWLRQTPGTRIVSVTQNDCGNWCTCPACAAMIEREGGPTGPALHLANEVARLLEPEFPDVLVDTFAYAYTEKAPARMAVHPRVLVRIAPIGNCFGHPIRTCPVNQRCRESVTQWARLARQIFVWHYVTDFWHYMSPFPNLPPLPDDLDFYLRHRVTGVFLQGDGTGLGGDMAELKSYLMARLLWNPSLDARRVREEFLAGYYRGAAGAVADYVALFEKAFAAGGKDAHLHLYRSAWENTERYLERPVLQRARRVLEGARTEAAGDPAVQARLDRIEAGLGYTELYYYDRPNPWRLGRSHLRCSASARRVARVRQLFTIARRDNLSHWGEQLNRYPLMTHLRRMWLDSLGAHPVVRVAAGGSAAVVVPDLGGRILVYGPAQGRLNLLGQGTPRTFGYPCAGGYEEYARRTHQTPGFCEAYRVLHKDSASVALRGELDDGLAIERKIRLDPRDGALHVSSVLSNPQDRDLYGCLRAHLEIDLGGPHGEVEVWLLRGGNWEPWAAGAAGGAWYDEEVPDGWIAWSPKKKLGLQQTWPHGSAGGAFLGTIPIEPRTVVLDLARFRLNQPLPAGGQQTIAFRAAWIRGRRPF